MHTYRYKYRYRTIIFHAFNLHCVVSPAAYYYIIII